MTGSTSKIWASETWWLLWELSALRICIVCMYVYIYMCVCMYVCMYICVCMYVYMCVYVCIYVCVYVYACLYVCTWYVCIMCMCMYICMFVCMYVCVYVVWSSQYIAINCNLTTSPSQWTLHHNKRIYTKCKPATFQFITSALPTVRTFLTVTLCHWVSCSRSFDGARRLRPQRPAVRSHLDHLPLATSAPQFLQALDTKRSKTERLAPPDVRRQTHA